MKSLFKVESESLKRLIEDTKVYLHDYSLGESFFNCYKLFLIVDYWPVLWFRLVKYINEKRRFINFFLKVLLALAKPIVFGLSGVRISPLAEIQGGLLLHHSQGILIGSGVIIGKNCTLYRGACIAYKANGKDSGSPTLGDNVRIMMGAKVLGGIKIGDNSIIGANAVVIKDVPNDMMAVGVPSKNLNKS